MIEIRVPATSANMGPGFDCLGIALSKYNTFKVEISESLEIEGDDESYCKEDNLFVKAYRRTGEILGVYDNIHLICDMQIPFTRGLGSSAALSAAGACACNVLHGQRLSRMQLLTVVASMEGHPDNAAPCIFGGMTAAMSQDGELFVRQIPVSSDFRYTVLIPDCEVSTESARHILPQSIPLKDAAANSAHSLMLVQALQSSDLSLLQASAHDFLHEPYRKKLIPHFDDMKQLCTESTEGAFFISGSGSTCLFISKSSLTPSAVYEIQNLTDPEWQAEELRIDHMGIQIRKADTWQAII